MIITHNIGATKMSSLFFLEGRNHLLGFKYMYIHIHVLICYVSFVKVAYKVGLISGLYIVQNTMARGGEWCRGKK